MDYCNVYINEKSVISQLANVNEVEAAVKTLLECLSLLDGCDQDCVKVQKFYCSGLYVASLSYETRLQNLSNKDLKKKFQHALKDAINWEEEPLSDIDSVYSHNGMDVSWSSMSEAYEKQFPLLVNFVQSPIIEPVAVVEKDGTSGIGIESFSNSELVAQRLISNGWRKKLYDFSSKLAPRDDESILADTAKFEPTDHRYKGRVMYRRIGTDHLCYIDSKHSGAAAHIEEFNETTKEPVCKLNINEDSVYRELTRSEKRRKLRFDE